MPKKTGTPSREDILALATPKKLKKAIKEKRASENAMAASKVKEVIPEAKKAKSKAKVDLLTVDVDADEEELFSFFEDKKTEDDAEVGRKRRASGGGGGRKSK